MQDTFLTHGVPETPPSKFQKEEIPYKSFQATSIT